ncbi:hypothetical protein F4821DRAFT_248153 [Hypoxylon rubiginosum]|uniref:Uncharacterized protein n=1 Tax=Hypoxylon rubiginosum TaxID=110542 RepID=A0ACC0CNN2_9PEZI|nr:hypothetical protein F4821DRAFT_248153 [Hypoxylon rubiginosum]
MCPKRFKHSGHLRIVGTFIVTSFWRRLALAAFVIRTLLLGLPILAYEAPFGSTIYYISLSSAAAGSFPISHTSAAP